MAPGPKWASNLISQEKFYWHIAMPICFINGRFCITTARVSGFQRDNMALEAKNIGYMTLFRKILHTST